MARTFKTAEYLGGDLRELYRAGASPSALVRRVISNEPNPLFVIVVLRAAFGLSLAQCKEAGQFWGEGATPEEIDDAGMDAFLRPLIESTRATWDRPTSPGDDGSASP